MNIEIENAKKELLNFVNFLNITDGENGNYSTILYLVENADDRLFVKILEEIRDGNFTFADFNRRFIDTMQLEKTISDQEKVYLKHKYYNNYLASLSEELETLEKSKNYELPNIRDIATKDEMLQIDKENIITGLLDTKENSFIEKLYKDEFRNKLYSNTESGELLDSLLMSFHDYVIPVEFNDITLSEYDIDYMITNNLTEDEMKKMKAFSIFLANS